MFNTGDSKMGLPSSSFYSSLSLPLLLPFSSMSPAFPLILFSPLPSFLPPKLFFPPTHHTFPAFCHQLGKTLVKQLVNRLVKGPCVCVLS